jgi:hypothetical protein
MLLLDSRADVLLETEDGQTAYEAAKESSYYERASYLESRGPHAPDLELGWMSIPPSQKLLEMRSLVMQDHGDACMFCQPHMIHRAVGLSSVSSICGEGHLSTTCTH